MRLSIVLENPWEDMLHRSYFLPTLDKIKNGDFNVNLPKDGDQPLNPLSQQGVYAKGNMANIL